MSLHLISLHFRPDQSHSTEVESEFEVAKEFLMSKKQEMIFSEHRRTMLHERKARLVQLAFVKDLTRKCANE